MSVPPTLAEQVTLRYQFVLVLLLSLGPALFSMRFKPTLCTTTEVSRVVIRNIHETEPSSNEPPVCASSRSPPRLLQ